MRFLDRQHTVTPRSDITRVQQALQDEGRPDKKTSSHKICLVSGLCVETGVTVLDKGSPKGTKACQAESWTMGVSFQRGKINREVDTRSESTDYCRIICAFRSLA